MAIKKTLTQMIEEPPASLPVTVEAVIGHVDMGRGTQHPFEAAMGIIARYHRDLLDGGGKFGDNVYRFPGPAEDETVVVTIASEFPKREPSDKDVR